MFVSFFRKILSGTDSAMLQSFLVKGKGIRERVVSDSSRSGIPPDDDVNVQEGRFDGESKNCFSGIAGIPFSSCFEE